MYKRQEQEHRADEDHDDIDRITSSDDDIDDDVTASNEREENDDEIDERLRDSFARAIEDELGDENDIEEEPLVRPVKHDPRARPWRRRWRIRG